MCHFTFSSTHLKYFILKEISELFALPDVSSAFISGLMILGCDYKIMKQVKGQGSPQTAVGTFYNLYAAPTYSTVVFCLLVLHNFSFYILYVYIFKKSLFWEKTYTVCLSFQIFYLKMFISTQQKQARSSIMWLCNCFFFLFSFHFFIRYNIGENFLQKIFFFLQQISPAVN